MSTAAKIETSRKRKVLEEYQKSTLKKVIFLVCLGGLIVVMMIVSLILGPIRLPLHRVLAGFFGGGTDLERNVIWMIRLPRIITAIFGGMGLALCGTVMQSILRNPIASPYTLGISQAAAFGAAFSIVVLGVLAGDSVLNFPYIISLAAFLFAMTPAVVILLLVKRKGAHPETMVLTGVAMGSVFVAGTTLLQYFATDVELASIVFWTFGDVGRTSWWNIFFIVLIITPLLIYFIAESVTYNVLNAEDETALSLGVEVFSVRNRGMIITSFVTAFIVSFVGIIGFVGLVAPHIARKIIGGDETFLLPSSAFIGGFILLSADTAARTVLSPVVLPVGILTSFLGAPLFVYLVVKGKRFW